MSPTPTGRPVEAIARAALWSGQIVPGRDWDVVEREIGTALPDDYKDLLSRFPSGTYRNAVWVASPVDARTKWPAFVDNEIREILEILGDESLEYLDGTDYRPFPEPGGLLPWGHDMQGGIFCWVTDGADPNRWRVTYYSQGMNEWQEHDGPMTEVLWEVLTRLGEETIFGYSLDEEPAVFRVPSTHAGNGCWIPNAGYR